MFPFKTKGILVAAIKYRPLERNRYEVVFADKEIEGILDGGHNSLAIGLSILASSGVNTKPIKTWDQFIDSWHANSARVDTVKSALSFLVPVELLVPADTNDAETVDLFSSSLVDICEARNNNVSLTDETQANKRGFYDALKEYLPDDISANVEWRSNEGGRIKPREIVSLSWIPLSVLNIPNGYRVNPNQIYRNKGVCVERFSAMMEDPLVSRKIDSTGSFELKHEGVRSALRALQQFPRIYDYIYEHLPEAYNRAGGSFGKISAVRMYDASKADQSNGKYLKDQPTTPFFETPVNYTCPDGFLIPLVYAMRAILKLKDEQVAWAVDPLVFLQRKLVEIMKSYRLAIEMANWDPQKIGKNISTYDYAEAVVLSQLNSRGN